MRALDGRESDPTILNAVYDRLGTDNPGDIVSFVYSGKTDKAAIAKFSAIALTLAEQGNPGSLAILDRGAEELYALAAAVQNRLGLVNQPIALLGGLLSGDNVYRRRVAQKLSRLGEVIYPAHDALWGAAQMAWEL